MPCGRIFLSFSPFIPLAFERRSAVARFARTRKRRRARCPYLVEKQKRESEREREERRSKKNEAPLCFLFALCEISSLSLSLSLSERVSLSLSLSLSLSRKKKKLSLSTPTPTSLDFYKKTNKRTNKRTNHDGTTTSLSLIHSLYPPLRTSTLTLLPLPQIPARISSYEALSDRLCVPLLFVSVGSTTPPMLQ